MLLTATLSSFKKSAKFECTCLLVKEKCKLFIGSDNYFKTQTRNTSKSLSGAKYLFHQSCFIIDHHCIKILLYKSLFPLQKWTHWHHTLTTKNNMGKHHINPSALWNSCLLQDAKMTHNQLAPRLDKDSSVQLYIKQWQSSTLDFKKYK